MIRDSSPTSRQQELLVVPAVDVKGGRCVRLLRGEMDAETVYFEDPVAAALRWASEGALYLHVVDLDAAVHGSSGNDDVLARICREVPVPVQVGGGIRTVRRALEVLDWGADRVVLGTAALEDPEVVAEAARRCEGRIAVAIDARGGRVAVRGWTRTSDVPAVELARRVEELGASRIVYTEIAKDGTLEGVDTREIRQVAEAVRIPVTASGGVGSLDDIRRLRDLLPAGVDSVIVGRALYAGAFRLADALRVARGSDAR